MSDAGSKRLGRRLAAVCLLAVAGLVGVAAWMARSPRFPGPPVPDPNGYDTLLAAAKRVHGVPPAQGAPDRATDDELRSFVAANEPALAAAAAGFEQESVVLLVRAGSLAAHLDKLGSFRQLGRALACRAVLARREGRPADAARASLDLLRLGHAIARGGLLVDQMTGVALRRQALDGLAGALHPQLPAEDIRRIITELERLDHQWEPVRAVADRDRAFILAHEGLTMRVVYLLHRKTFDALSAPAVRSFDSAEGQVRAQAHVLLARLALQAHARDHPDAPRPTDLRGLVPAYLAAVPLAPDGSRPLTLADLPPEAGSPPGPPDRP